LEVIGLLGIVTGLGWLLHLDYHPLGHLYLVAVIVVSLRVSLRYAVSAALLSALAWNYIFIPPKMSFAVVDFDGCLLLGTYLFSAVLGSQLTARTQEERRLQEARERQARSLLYLAEALVQAHTFEEIVRTSVAKTDDLFGTCSGLLLFDGPNLVWQRASTFVIDEKTSAVVFRDHQAASAPYFHEQYAFVNLNNSGEAFGVLVIKLAKPVSALSTIDQALMQGVAAQIALSLERERVQQQNQCEALYAEHERMHRVLLNSVSHELKTPLAVLRTATEKLPNADATRSNLLHSEIRVAMARLDGLVANLLTQSRIQSGRLDAELDWCDLRDVVFAAQRSIAPLLSRHSLQIEISDDFPFIFADCRLLEEAIYNLFSNAVRYAPEGSEISLQSWDSPSEERIGLFIADNGPGLDPTYARTLFSPFRRGKTAPPGGVGLGLSIVHGLMLAQHGGAEYTGGPDRGAIFKLWIPRKSSEAIPVDEP
jgi:two-component system sensor histidine kinase KdpD